MAWNSLGFELSLSFTSTGKPGGATSHLGGKREVTHGFKEGSEPLRFHSRSVSERGLIDTLTGAVLSFHCRLQ